MEPEHQERFDPIEAFFSGLSSSFMRGLVGVAAAALAYLANCMASKNSEFGLIGLHSIFMVFIWAEYGIAFLVGLVLLLGGLYLIYRFMVDEGGKLHWFLIFATFALFYSPMNFPSGEEGSNFALARFAGILTAASVLYWFLPGLASMGWSRMRQKKASPGPDVKA